MSGVLPEHVAQQKTAWHLAQDLFFSHVYVKLVLACGCHFCASALKHKGNKTFQTSWCYASCSAWQLWNGTQGNQTPLWFYSCSGRARHKMHMCECNTSVEAFDRSVFSVTSSTVAAGKAWGKHGTHHNSAIVGEPEAGEPARAMSYASFCSWRTTSSGYIQVYSTNLPLPQEMQGIADTACWSSSPTFELLEICCYCCGSLVSFTDFAYSSTSWRNASLHPHVCFWAFLSVFLGDLSPWESKDCLAVDASVGSSNMHGKQNVLAELGKIHR